MRIPKRMSLVVIIISILFTLHNMVLKAFATTSFDTFFTLYIFVNFIALCVSGLVCPKMACHGRNVKGLSKVFFAAFYLISAAILLKSRNIFILHPLRRLIETLVYCRNSKSKISPVHFLSSTIYYILFSLYIANRHIEPYSFIAANVLQAVAHYRVFVLKKCEYCHYLTEVAIYAVVFWSDRTCALFWNMMYAFAFALICARQRCQERSQKTPTARVPRERALAKQKKPAAKSTTKTASASALKSAASKSAASKSATALSAALKPAVSLTRKAAAAAKSTTSASAKSTSSTATKRKSK